MKSIYEPYILSEIKIPEASRHEILKMIVTDQGIYLLAHYGGIWFLPYSDVDAYLKSAQANSSTTAK